MLTFGSEKIILNAQKLMSSEPSRQIPSAIKRLLRQEANFGCCKCGNPILEYHHIIEWSKIYSHNPQDMMVLCPSCHHSIPSYSETNQRKFKLNPYNKQNQNKNGELIISQGICVVDTGSIKLIGDGPLVTANNESIIEFYVNEYDILELSLKLMNQAGELILEIVKSEWIKGDIEIWDIEFLSASRTLKIKEKEGKTNLEINANKIPVLVRGQFWISGQLLKFNKSGIHVGNSISLLTHDKSSKKFGIHHFREDAFQLRLLKNENESISPQITKKTFETNSTTLTGSEYYSGCSIDLSEKNALSLKPKPTPYELNGVIETTWERAEKTLLQSLNTIAHINNNLTLNDDISNPLSNGMEIIPKEISTIPFRLELARFYVSTGKIQDAITQYHEAQKIQHLFYKKPNKQEGETFFEIAKYLKHVRDFEGSKYRFSQAALCFEAEQNGQLPFRLLDFSKSLYARSDQCFCGSGLEFYRCHKRVSKLNKYWKNESIEIEIHGLKDQTKISLFLLNEHKTHHTINKEAYFKSYEMIHSQQYDNSFIYKINTLSDLPILIRIDSYGYLPKTLEFVLRKEGFKISLN